MRPGYTPSAALHWLGAHAGEETGLPKNPVCPALADLNLVPSRDKVHGLPGARDGDDRCLIGPG